MFDHSTSTVHCNQLAEELFDLDSALDITAAPLNRLHIQSPLSDTPVSMAAFLTSQHRWLTNTFNIVESGQVIQVKKTILSAAHIYFFEPVAQEQKHDNFDKVIANISSQLIDIQSDSVDEKIEDALKTMGTFCQADRSYLFQFSQDGMLMSNTHEWVNQGITPFKDLLQDVPQEALPYFFNTLKTSGIFMVPDVSKLPTAAELEKTEFQSEGIKSLLCIALHSESALFGFIGCDCVNSKHNWTETDLLRIKLVGEILTSALKNASYKLHIEDIQNQLLKVNKELKSQANIDSLTTIANRRRFDQTLSTEIQRAARANKPLSLIICDIDYFKLYNDNFGHQQGDRVLKQVAITLNDLCKREGDLAARYGGEEFAIILPCLNETDCYQFAQLLQKNISELKIDHPFSDISEYLTMSVGCFTCIPDKYTQEDFMILAADSALYKAKNSGRNHIHTFTNHLK
jgi:diguanylate cyclase (GGDEF)-like protein